MLSRKLATLEQLQTTYGSEDLYDLLEIVIVDNRNEELAQPQD